MQITSALVSGAELTAFRLMGDAPAPPGRGVLIRAPQAALVDIEVTGASSVPIVVDGTSFAAIVASNVQDNPGAALTRRSALARLAHNVFMRNGTPERVRRSFVIDDGANLLFTGNVCQDVNRDARSTLSAPPRIRRGR
jgi:hypothetical protein